MYIDITEIQSKFRVCHL